MGRRQFLTVRKRRCKERDALQERKEEQKACIAQARAIKHVYGGLTKGENGELTMNRSTNNNHQQIDITEGRVDKQRAHITGTQIDNEKGLQIDNGPIDIESRAWINSGETDCESGVQTDSRPADNERGAQYGDERGLQIGNDSRKDAGLSQQHTGSNTLTDQSNESAFKNDALALAHDDFNYDIEDHNDDVDWDDSVSFDVSTISNSSAANSLFVPDECDVSMDSPSVALDEAFTCPEPANWTFSQDFPQLTDISISDIGMDMEQACVSNGGSAEIQNVDSFQALQNSLQTYSLILQGWFILPNSHSDVIKLCTHETNRVGSPVISYTIEIMQNCQWCLRIPQGVISWKTHPVLKELPAVITAPNDVKEIVETINYSKRCHGINNEKFIHC